MKFLVWFLVVGFIVAAWGDNDSIQTKCASVLQKVTPCLAFATAKAAAPSKDCCESVTELKDENPACLCFIIQQIHNGSNPAIKSMGVQESRLLQLPSVCKLANASITECPKLLNLAPNSPDAAIFTNASSSATTPVSTSPTSASSTTPSSNAYSHQPPLAVAGSGDESIQTKCSPLLQKVTPCLAFVTAKAATPSKDCCESVTELKDENPACLCFLIQQIHNDSNPAIKSMGVQESRLLQLPSVCKMANVSKIECQLLNLAPNSLDAAIFTNASSSTTTPVSTSPTSASSTMPSSNAYSHQPPLAGYLTLGAMAIAFFTAFN